jgi:hypothetical protein
VNGDGGLQKCGRRPEGLCRTVSERMARIGCGTTKAAVGWNWLPLLVARWCLDLWQRGGLGRTVSWRLKEGGWHLLRGYLALRQTRNPFFFFFFFRNSTNSPHNEISSLFFFLFFCQIHCNIYGNEICKALTIRKMKYKKMKNKGNKSQDHWIEHWR